MYLYGYLSQDPAPPPPPLPQEQIVPTACPECSYLEGGTCHWCENNDPRPGCEGCVDHKRPPPPWYKRSELVVPMAVAVTTAVVSAVAIHYVSRGKF